MKCVNGVSIMIVFFVYIISTQLTMPFALGYERVPIHPACYHKYIHIEPGIYLSSNCPSPNCCGV